MVDLVRLAQVISREAVAVAGGGRRVGVMDALARFLRSMNIWFWAIVGVPTLIAAIYFFAIAADMYVTEVKFVVRGPSKPPLSGFSALLGNATAIGAEDAFAVNEFLMSRDAVRLLDQKNNLRAMLTRPEGDLLTRFPGLQFWRTDFEALYKAYAHFVTVEVDASTGINTLQIKAYRPDDAQNLGKALLGYSEQLINDLNERARQDAVGAFQREVASAERRIAQTQEQLTAYRIKQKMLDPKSAAAGPLLLLSQIEGQLSNSRAQLAEVIKNAPSSPQIPLLKTRIGSLEKLVADERAKVTGDDNSVASTLSEYERLDLQRLLGEKLLASSVSSLESARLEAQRQQLYLETITQPNLADYPLYPRRIASFAIVVTTCLLAYGIAWVLVAGIREHASA
jgi:capsular polysaccharide transport system permease protein